MKTNNNTKVILDQKNWNMVADELASENIKLASYDRTLIPLLGDVFGKKILDYGSGPGILALALKRLGADISVYDINQDILKKAGEKIGMDRVYRSVSDMPKEYFDFIICNLVLCIVPENEVKSIVQNIKTLLKDGGSAYIGFCNPRIFNVSESHLDLRFPTGNAYGDNHQYKKVKKEGNYEIIETHRPVEWYEEVFKQAGLSVVEKIYTPSYVLNNVNINDFIIFKLKK